jgi:hypothetical protein
MRWWRVSQTDDTKRSEDTDINATLYAQLGTSLKTVLGMGGIVEVLIIASQAEPGSGITCTCSSLKIAECLARIVWNAIWVSTARFEGSTEVECFSGV